jgi:hypothetical protein
MVLCKDAMQAWEDGGARRKMDYPSERVMDCRILGQDCSGKDVGVHLVNAHAPVGRASANEWDALFFADLETSTASVAAGDIVMIGGDFNSSIGVDPTTTPRTHKSQYHPRGPFGVDYIRCQIWSSFWGLSFSAKCRLRESGRSSFCITTIMQS